MTGPGLLLRSALLGVACGGRSQAGPAALAWTTLPHGPVSAVGSTWKRGATAFALVGECIVDKLPQTPPRVGFPQILVRVATGAGSAAVLARRAERGIVAPALIGGGTAFLASFVGVGWRSVAAERFGSDLPGALSEDVVSGALGLAAAA